MGVPYVSEEESGLNELAEIYPILFYKCEQSLKHCLDVIANNSSFCQLLQKCQTYPKIGFWVNFLINQGPNSSRMI